MTCFIVEAQLAVEDVLGGWFIGRK